MLKLTRLNNHPVAINPDHISWVDSTPDTTLFLIGGEKMVVREGVDELIALVVQFRRMLRVPGPLGEALGVAEGDPPRIGIATHRNATIAERRHSAPPERTSNPPTTVFSSRPPRSREER